ncbi:VWA domain-containing protein [Geodermatophilus sp. SYSU D00804]
MHVTATLDIEAVALEARDEVSVLLQLTAPATGPTHRRPPAALVVVLDRSGSMAGERLHGARRALADLVDRLDPDDRFGLVVFDNKVDVVVPVQPCADKESLKRRIRAVEAGGTTDLSAGYLRGLQEARRAIGAGDCAMARVLLISDGHANAGVVDPDRLAGVAGAALAAGVTTTTLGFGLGFDETLLGAVARGGGGAELFAEDADTAVGAIAAEVDGLLSQSVQAASLLVEMTPQVAAVAVANDLPAQPVPGGVMVELGGFLSGEVRKVVLSFAVPGMPALGLARIATLTLRYVAVPALVEQVVALPVQVNVVPGDAAAGRVPDPVVRSELLYQRAQAAKRSASRLLQAGDVPGALRVLTDARRAVEGALAAAPGELATDLREESAQLQELALEAGSGLATRASKRMSADAALKSRTRGRRPS